MRLITSTVVASVLLVGASPSLANAGEPSGGGERNDFIAAEATTRSPDRPPPPPDCWWQNKSASVRDFSDEQGFWRQIDGGDHQDDVTVFFENGYLHRSFTSVQTTYVLQARVCTDRTNVEAGRERWVVSGPPDPTVLWDELTERVVRRVPAPAPHLGFELASDGSVRVTVNLGLWIAVDNPDDVVARAEPAPGVWAETRARLDHIEFLSGTGGTSGECPGAGTPLPAGDDTVAEGPCGYTYRTVDELGDHTATLRAVWSVTNTTSTGASEVRPSIRLETLIPVRVAEIQTVGVASG